MKFSKEEGSLSRLQLRNSTWVSSLPWKFWTQDCNINFYLNSQAAGLPYGVQLASPHNHVFGSQFSEFLSIWRVLRKIYKNEGRKIEDFLLTPTGFKWLFINHICQVIAKISTWLSGEMTALISLVFCNTSSVSHTPSDISTAPCPPGAHLLSLF